MSIVTIVGAGLMGSATAYPLSDNGHTVRLVGTHLDNDIITSCKERGYHPRLKRQLPPNVTPHYVNEAAKAIEDSDIVLSGVNSLGVHWMGKTIGPLLQPGQLLIAITKGLEIDDQGELLILPDVVRSEVPADLHDKVTYAAVGGPCIAGELAGRRQSLVVFGSRDAEAVEKLAQTFGTDYYHIWTTTDLRGLEFGAALKNAYTMGVGLSAGILEKNGGVDSSETYMHNLAAGLFAESTTEMKRLMEVAGVNPAFAYGLPGAGDLYVTCMGGRTVKLGRLIGAGHTFAEAREIMSGETLEAVEIIRVMGKALPLLEKKGKLSGGELPFLRALIGIIVEGKTAEELPLDAFFGGKRI